MNSHENRSSPEDRLPRHLLIGFTLAVVGYFTFFAIDQHIRTRKGPWEITFGTNQNGFPEIIINQKRLNVADVRVVFMNESASNASATVIFDRPLKEIPFGKTQFEDLTYLPGSVAFDFFGHEVELLPRILYLNKKEHAWKNGEHIELSPGEKLPASMKNDPRKRKKR